ncbi:hypothetical protein [Streptomyces spirodelae]|uniref:DUF2690 domain-containing protein n=1 Tax=Streptomyces spirodelae TaxID=2812904 RepID=A0ABS3WMU3_9ACTN|nr:hypothetical protein [Streptomyces spirodelae]MBO8184448.1 hypothetical protein [Streptomyces spirodelae]
MRNFSPAKGLVATAACAMMLVPAGAAQAGGGAPAPAPASSTAGEVTAGNTSPEAETASPMTRAAHVCKDAYQIGSTGYIKRKGYTIGSVKQFYSPRCHRNYGYLYVWKGFRKHHRHYTTTVGVYDFNVKKLLGLRIFRNTSASSFWSYPTNTVRHCTAARGSITVPGEQKHYAYSSKRC